MTCRQFLRDRLAELLLPDAQPAYAADAVFFGDMPRDWLKDHAYGANCLIFSDRQKKDGSLVARMKNDAGTHYVRRRRLYRRTLAFRVLLYAGDHDHLWTPVSGGKGLVEQFQDNIAPHRVIADADNNAIAVRLGEAARPWDADIEQARIRRRPHLGVVRLDFVGGVYADTLAPIIPDVNLVDGVSSS